MIMLDRCAVRDGFSVSGNSAVAIYYHIATV
jgi:hypothetical protein